jgi:integrase
MKIQEGYLTVESGAWLGHFSRWTVNACTGEKKRRQLAFRIGPASMTKTAAREKLRERIVSELGLTADNRVTLGWFIEYRWKPTRESTWRDSTKQTNEELLKIITARFGATALEDMDAVEMQQWLAALAKERSGSAVKHLRIFLMSIMREAVDQHYLHSNPARLLRVPKLKAVTRVYLTIPEIKALMKATLPWDSRENALLSLILTTALRPSELLALRWRCLDFKKETLTIEETVYRGKLRPYTKTSEQGDIEGLTLHVPDSVLIALQQWHELAHHCDYETEHDCNGDDFIFPTESGTFWWKENYQRRVLTPLVKRAGISKTVNFQCLRRTVATHAQNLGSPKDIQTIMRHKKAETAQQHYIQVIDESVKATTEKLASKLLHS